MTRELQYAYGVVRGAGAPDPVPPGVSGVAGGPVRAVHHLGLAVLASPVPAEEFEEGPLRARLEDLAWLEEVARAHQRVVNAAGAVGCVVPVGMATVCRGEEGLRRMLEEGRARFAAALDRLEGRVEWGVKVYAAPADRNPAAGAPATAPARAPSQTLSQTPSQASSQAPSRAPSRAVSGAVSGREYLRRRTAERQAREQRWQRTEDGARLVHDTLAGLAERARLHPPQDARLSGEADRNVLNAAYLVPREDSADFAERVRELAGRVVGLRVELTGPWAPYSFVAPGPAGETRAAS
ncbi:GvpL/GvpF family gas vesicle protein [Streptomyces sp. ME19-01-6]|uniref:GvpL/GvpF family gas vesicle protein n=1 Tax=Streptomyces sp. ME19-01-6 TaxID=3028686 RepID=UPI0029B43D5A|nr:GvpL/GvpF family gas vesicle protein [Streptomyces sp. ME19-01-6]MDX3231563.1 GvpL/GvpF family gas vesicle protein [Streptomyces sp. ME19-01-6]